jgi:peroxiredoxin Q/BCP
MAQAAKKTKAKTKAKTRLTTKKAAKLPKRIGTKKTNAKKTKAKVKPKARATKKALPKTRPSLKAIRATNPTPTAPSVPRLGVGDLAPSFTLNDQNGAPVSLTDFRGKKVVLYFYPKDDTPGCTKEACSFRDHLPTFEGADASILGVSFDDQASHQKFIEKYQLNFKLLSDLSKEVADAYGCYVEKNMYGNISKGIERSTFVIDRDGKVAAAFRKVSVDGHTQEVLEALSKIA